MSMIAELLVTKVGSGSITDEDTKKTSPWSKVYALDLQFVQNDMFTGFAEVHYPIVDPVTHKPSPEIAEQIKQKFASLKPKAPALMKFNLVMSTVAKRQVLSISGLA